jgi:hypothetical protein
LQDGNAVTAGTIACDGRRKSAPLRYALLALVIIQNIRTVEHNTA